MHSEALCRSLHARTEPPQETGRQDAEGYTVRPGEESIRDDGDEITRLRRANQREDKAERDLHKQEAENCCHSKTEKDGLSDD